MPNKLKIKKYTMKAHTKKNNSKPTKFEIISKF